MNLPTIPTPAEVCKRFEQEDDEKQLRLEAEARKQLVVFIKALDQCETLPLEIAHPMNDVTRKALEDAGWKIQNIPLKAPLAGPGTYPKWRLSN